jgi:1,4-alpha-glucan branching enzyme
MALKKTYSKTGSTCIVSFELSADASRDANEVYLVGDFNNWNKSDPDKQMKKNQDGSFSIKVPLERDHEYQFRYLIDGIRWENDWAADRYVGTPYSAQENSVVIV